MLGLLLFACPSGLTRPPIGWLTLGWTNLLLRFLVQLRLTITYLYFFVEHVRQILKVG